MTDAPASAPTRRVERYHPVSRLFHWVVALLVLIMIPVGIAMTSQGFQGVEDELYILHKGLGSVLLVLVLLRLLWRLTHTPPPPPPSLSPIQARLLSFTHGFLYFLLVVMTVSGYTRTVGEGFPIELLNWLGIPPLVPEMPEVAQKLSVVHKFSAYLLVGTIATHIAAATSHALSSQDRVWERIWPPLGGGSSGGSGSGG